MEFFPIPWKIQPGYVAGLKKLVLLFDLSLAKTPVGVAAVTAEFPLASLTTRSGIRESEYLPEDTLIIKFH